MPRKSVNHHGKQGDDIFYLFCLQKPTKNRGTQKNPLDDLAFEIIIIVVNVDILMKNKKMNLNYWKFLFSRDFKNGLETILLPKSGLFE